MRYCKNCGAKIDEQTGCCVNCGMVEQVAEKKKKNVLFRIIIAIAAIFIIFVVVKMVVNFFVAKGDVAKDDGYKDVVEQLVDAVYKDADVTKFVALMPDELVQKKIDDNFDGDRAAFEANMQETNTELMSQKADEGSVTWSIEEKQDITGVQLSNYEDAFSDEAGTSIKIQSAKALNLSVSYTMDGEKKQENIYVILGIIDGKWYLVSYTEA